MLLDAFLGVLAKQPLATTTNKQEVGTPSEHKVKQTLVIHLLLGDLKFQKIARTDKFSWLWSIKILRMKSSKRTPR